jgi:hypothetical protein
MFCAMADSWGLQVHPIFNQSHITTGMTVSVKWAVAERWRRIGPVFIA